MNLISLKLGDLFDVKHGFAFKSEFFTESGDHIVLTPGNFFEEGGFKARPGKDRYYSGEYPNDYLLKKGDILIAMTEQAEGLLGSPIEIPKDDKFLHNQRLGKITDIKENIVDKDFLYYLFNHKYVRGKIRATCTGSTVRHTSPDRIKDVDVNIPENLYYQKLVGRLLKNIDHKIRHNIQTNQTLEEIARTIFKSWFVDFDPVHTKKLAIEAGLSKNQAERAAMAIISGVCGTSDVTESFEEMDKKLSTKLSKLSKEKQEELAHTASLFPSDFEDSEKDTVPKGFKTKFISDIADVIGGGTPSTKVEEYFCGRATGIPWLSPKDLSGYYWKYISHGATDITELGLKKSSAKLMPKGTIIISSRAPIGYVAIAEGELSTNQGFKSLVPLQDIGSNFLYNWAKSNVVAMEAVATGSTFKEISGTNMKNLKVIVPSKDLIRKFEELVGHNSELQKNLRHETNNLECLRDTLLPKLLNGEIDLSEVSLD